MNIRCERCGRSYLFDEELVGDAGVAVQCTDCGHSFRIFRPLAGAARLASPPTAGNWLVRQRSGNVISFQELLTLQRWVEEGKVGRDDEISRSGGVWRRIGSIPEFQGLFEMTPAEGEKTAPPVAYETTDPFEPSRLADAAAASAWSMKAAEHRAAPPPRDEAAFTLGPGASDHGTRGTPAWAEALAPKGARATPAPAKAATDPAARSWSLEPAQRISVAELAEDDEMAPPRRRRVGLKVALAFMAILALAAAGLYLFQRPLLLRLFGMAPAPAAESAEAIAARERGVQALRRDDLAEAEAELSRAARLAPGDARTRALLSETYATWSDYHAEVGSVAQAAQSGAQALARAEEAARIAPALLEVRIARANALRTARRAAEADQLAAELERDRVRSALLSYLQGALAAADPNRWGAAERWLRDALALDGTFLRAHVKLSRLSREKRDYEAARRHLEAVLAAAPAHPFARKILANIPPSLTARPALAPAPAAAPPRPPPPKAPPAAAPKKLSVKQILAKAERLRESDPRKAVALYDELLARGSSGRAHRGKGWAHLELNQFSLAAREFQRAIALGTRGDAYVGLGTAYRRLNQRDLARKQFEKYLELYPDGEDAPVAKTNLDSLK